MNRLYTFKKISDDFFVMTINNIFMSKEDPHSIHTFFMNKNEVDTLIQKILAVKQDAVSKKDQDQSQNQ